MNYYQLKYFQLAAQEENLTRAAMKANLSQQALSSSIAALEKELGLKLFDRVGRKVMLNKNGKIVLNHTDNILKEYSVMFSELHASNDAFSKTLYVANTSTHALKHTIASFFLFNDDIKFNLSTIAPEAIAQSIESGNMDFIISSEPYESSTTESRLLFEERINLIVSSSHPLADRKSIRLEDTKDCIFALSLPENAFRRHFDHLCKKAGFQPKVLLETNIEDTISLAVLKNMAVSVAVESASTIPYYQGDDTCIIPIENDYAKRPIYLIWKKKDKYPEHWKRFFHYVTDEKNHF